MLPNELPAYNKLEYKTYKNAKTVLGDQYGRVSSLGFGKAVNLNFKILIIITHISQQFLLNRPCWSLIWK